MKTRLRILALLLTVPILIATLSACGARRRPLNYLKSSLERTVDRSTGGELLSLLWEAVQEGSLSLAFTGDTAAPVSAGSATLYFDVDKGALMADTALTLDGKKYDAGLWLSHNTAALSSTAFLGSTTVGANLATLEQDLKNSIFRSNSGTVFARPEVDDRTDDRINTLVGGLFSLYQSSEDMADLLDERIERFLIALTEHANHSRYTEKGQVNIYLKIDNSMLSRALRDAWGEAVKDKAFCAHLREVAKTRDAMYSAIAGVEIGDTAALVENWLVNDAEIEALCVEIDNSTPFTLELSATVRKLTAKVTTLSVKFECADTVRAATVDLSARDEAVLSLTVDGVTHKLAFETEKETLRTYRAIFTYQLQSVAGTKETRGTLDVNRREERYTLTLTGDTVRTLTGKLSLGKDAFAFSIDSLTAGEEQIPFTFSLAIRSEADMPAVPAYVNLPTVSESRFLPVAARATATMAQFTEALGSSGILLTPEGIADYFYTLTTPKQ